MHPATKPLPWCLLTSAYSIYLDYLILQMDGLVDGWMAMASTSDVERRNTCKRGGGGLGGGQEKS